MKTLQRALSSACFALAISWSCAAGAALTLTVQPIHICDDAGLNCGNAAQTLFEAQGDKIWAQAGIDLVFRPWLQLNETDWLNVDIGNDAVIHTEAQNVMTAGTGLNDTNTTLAINMFFAPLLDNDTGLFGLGCGGPVFAAFCNNQVGVFVGDNVFSFNGGVGRLDTLAHELGHVLNLQHTATANELMASGSVRTIPGSINDITPDGAMLDQLTQAQIDEALGSRFLVVSSVPEPGTLALVAFGLLGAAVRRRKAA